MTDTQTRRPIRVSTDGTAGPYIMVPVPQLDAIRALLERHGINFWVDADAISLGGKPAIVVVNLGRAGKAAHVQAILDAAG